MKLYFATRKHVVHVELNKQENACLGIVPKGASKDGKRPTVKSIQFKSVAHRSHCVGTGDVILSICGQDSTGMSKRDVKRLFREEKHIDLELEYELKEPRFSTSGIFRFQRMSISIKKVYGSFGFILRKYGTKNGICSEYPIVSNIRSGGSITKNSCLRAGDRLIQIDGRNLSGLSLTEVSDILAENEEATFLIEYTVALVDSSVRVGERSVLEFDYLDADLGIVLAVSAKDASSIFIESILKGSLAERCGAFHVGDVVLCINDIATSHLAASEANALIQGFNKQKGRIIYVPNKEKSQIQQEISSSYFETNINFLKKLSPMTRSFIFDQSQLIPPKNSPASLYNWHFKKTHSTLEKSDSSSFDFQVKTITMVQDVIRNISNFEQFLPFLPCDPFKKYDEQEIRFSNEDKKHNFVKVNEDRLSQLKAICTETKDSARRIAMHLIKNSIKVSVLSSDGERKSPDDSDNGSYFKRSKMLLELTDNLTEIYTRQIISKHALDNFLKNVSSVDFDCCECYPLCLSAALTIQKVVLLLSLNDHEWDIKFITNKLVMKAISVDVPCEDCRTPWCSVSDIGKPSPVVKDGIIKEEFRCTKNETLVTDPFSFSLLHTSSDDKGFINPSEASHKIQTGSCQASNETLPEQAQVELNVSKRSAFYSLTQNNCESLETLGDSAIVCNSQQEIAQKISSSVENLDHSTILQDYQPKGHPEVQNGSNQLSKETLKRLLSRKTIAENYTNNFQEKIHTDKGPLATPNKNWKSEEAILKDNELTSTKLLPSCHKISSDPIGFIHKFRSSVGLFKRCKTLPAKLSPGSFEVDCRSKSTPSNNFTSSSNEVERKKKQYSTTEVRLKDEGKGFGLEIGMVSFRNFPLVPVVLDVKPESAAAKVGIIMKGDRIVTINGQNTIGMSSDHLTELTREAFAGIEVALMVEFDVVIPEMRFGTFDICFDKSLKPGLEFKDMRKGSPLVVKGVVKGSAAHRSGHLFPGDEILYTNCIRQETFDSSKCSYQRTDMVLMTIRRKATQDESTESSSHSEETSLPQTSSTSSTTEEEDSFVVHRTSIHTLADCKDTVLDQHLTLFRDKDHLDFGFLVGQNQKTGAVYVTGIRPGGPADKAKVIKKKDRIIEIDGSSVRSGEKSSLSLLLQAGDRLDLITRRVLSFREG